MRLAKALLVSLIAVNILIPGVWAAFTARTETYVNVSSLTTPFNFTLNKPSGTVDGDILFTFICIGDGVINPPATVDSVPANWNLIATRLVSTYYRFYLYWHIASGDGASYAWSLTASNKLHAVCSCYTSGDFNPADPIDSYSDTQYITADTILRASSFSVTTANSPLFFTGGVYHTTARTFTKPTVPENDWVEDDDAGSTTPDWWSTACSQIWSGSGATGNIDDTISAADAHKHAFAVALNPPGASEYSRSASQGVTCGPSASRAIDLSRPASQGVSFTGVAGRMIEVGETASQVLSWVGASSTLAELERLASQGVSWGSTVAQVLDYGRAASQGMTFGGVASEELDYTRAAAQALGWAGTVAWGIDISRMATQTVSIVNGAQRLIDLTRGASQAVSASWEAEGGIAGIYNAAATLVIYVKTMDPPVAAALISMFQVIIGVFIFLGLMLYTRRR